MTTFIVNGQEKELEMRVNGIDISADFIGNTSHGMACDDEGRYIATQEDFEWWQETIEAHQWMDDMIGAYKNDHGANLVDQVVNDWIDADLDDQPSQVAIGLKKVLGLFG